LFKQVEAHSADGKIVIFTETDSLETPQILPGFSCQVSDLFD
jgi:hypothetical protein